MFLLPPIFYSFIFLSPLFLADFDTLNYIFWYISNAVVFSSFNIFSMVLVILYLFFQCFLNMLLFFWFFWFFYICFIYWHWYIMIFIIGLCFFKYFVLVLCLPISLYLMWCLGDYVCDFNDFVYINYVDVFDCSVSICVAFLKVGFVSLIYIGCSCVYWFLWV